MTDTTRRARRARRIRSRRFVAAGIVAIALLGAGWWALRSDGDASDSAAAVSTAPSSTSSTVTPPEESAATIPGVDATDLDDAEQVVVVTATGGSTAILTAYELTNGSWREQFGPWDAVVGANGVAEPGAKREGDGATPSGSYPFDFFFGVQADPGVRFPYRRVTSSDIVWDDDSSSPNYNQWVDSSVEEAGASPEPMNNSPVYDYGAVVAYNPERIPGLGSAIFLHVAAGSATAGCVALPEEQLVELLRWLDPSRDPRVVIRPPSGSDVVTPTVVER